MLIRAEGFQKIVDWRVVVKTNGSKEDITRDWPRVERVGLIDLGVWAP